MRNRIRRRQEETRGSERGAALVECALVLPLFLMVAMGTFTGGLAFNQKLQLTHAAREGARFGATVPANQTFVAGTWAENVRDLVVARGAGDLNAAAGVVVCVALVEGSPAQVVTSPRPQSWYTTNGTLPCDGAETYPVTDTDVGRRVQVSVQRPGKLEAIFFSMNLTLRAKATGKSET